MNNSANAATTATSAGDDPDAPNTANRWKMELRNHGSKFFNSLDDLISVVDKPEELFKMLHEIGVKHKSYEVKPEHISVSVVERDSLSSEAELVIDVVVVVFRRRLGHRRRSQSYDGVRSARQMDRCPSKILRTID